MAEAARQSDQDDDARVIISPALAVELQRLGLPMLAGHMLQVVLVTGAEPAQRSFPLSPTRIKSDRSTTERRSSLEHHDDVASTPYSATSYFGSFSTDDPQLSENAKTIVRGDRDREDD